MGWLDNNGRKVYYESVGRGAPIILCHGLFYNHSCYQRLATILVNLGWRIYLLDLPGHGRSDILRKYNLATFVEAIHLLIIKERIEKPILLGHSGGGIIDLEYAEQYPVKAVWLCDAVPFRKPIKYAIEMYAILIHKALLSLLRYPVRALQIHLLALQQCWKNRHSNLLEFVIQQAKQARSWKNLPPVLLFQGERDIAASAKHTDLDDAFVDITKKMIPGDHDWPVLSPESIEQISALVKNYQ